MIRPDDTARGRLGAGVDASVEDRLPFLVIVILLVFGAFIVRLFQLQIIMGEVFAEESDKNSVRLVRLEAPRGDILDREGRVIATTRPAFGLQVLPSDLRNPELAFRALSQLLGEDAAGLREQVGEARGRARFQPVRLAGDLSYDRLASVESHLYALPGVMTDVRPRRDYVGGDLAAHVLGYLGEVQRSQLETRDYVGYRSGDVVGQAGIEALEQSHLRGRDGGRNVVVDVRGRVVDVLDEEDPVTGGSVTLTLDLDLQRIAEEAFQADVKGEPAKMGALIAMDVNTGDVLALVSKPSYDPNVFAGGVSAVGWKELTTGEWKPLQNRAIAGQYPPGSTYKAIVAAAALQERVITPGGLVYCPGHFTLGRRTYGCWKKEGHGSMSLRDALVQSCDVYFYQAGLKLGVDRLAFFARGFNLGRRTGIELPSEQPGLIPTAAWKERRFSEPWGAGETVSASIGQGFDLTTPLQLAVAYAAIANGGRVVRPRLVLRTQDPERSHRGGPGSRGGQHGARFRREPGDRARCAHRRRRGAARHRWARARARDARRRQDRHGAGRASAAHEGSRGRRGAGQVSRPRLVRRVRASRCAADRRRGPQRTRRPRRQRCGADRAARARALGGEAPSGGAGGRSEDGGVACGGLIAGSSRTSTGRSSSWCSHSSRSGS